MLSHKQILRQRSVQVVYLRYDSKSRGKVVVGEEWGKEASQEGCIEVIP